MDLEIGSVLEGKVTGITKFGAFVLLPGGQSGLVHISEIANAFVNDVNDYLHTGDMVKVKVLSVNEAGKINLSIKQAQPPVPRPSQGAPRPSAPKNAGRGPAPTPRRAGPPVEGELLGPSGDASFEDKLKHFMAESDSKVSGNKLYGEKKSGRRRR